MSLIHRDATTGSASVPASATPRRGASADDVQRFRERMGPSGSAMAEGDAASSAPSAPRADAVQEAGGGSRGSADFDTAEPPPETLAYWQLQLYARADAAPLPPAAASAATAPALAELLERHIRQLAVRDATAAQPGGEVLLRLRESTLAGTDLLLRRTAGGWTLEAHSRSAGSLDAIREATPRLARRFDDKELGSLTVETRLME